MAAPAARASRCSWRQPRPPPLRPPAGRARPGPPSGPAPGAGPVRALPPRRPFLPAPGSVTRDRPRLRGPGRPAQLRPGERCAGRCWGRRRSSARGRGSGKSGCLRVTEVPRASKGSLLHSGQSAGTGRPGLAGRDWPRWRKQPPCQRSSAKTSAAPSQLAVSTRATSTPLAAATAAPTSGT